MHYVCIPNHWREGVSSTWHHQTLFVVGYHALTGSMLCDCVLGLCWHCALSLLVYWQHYLFNGVSKVICIWFCFCFATLCDWNAKLICITFATSEEQTKTNRGLLTRVFLRLTLVHALALNSNWLVGPFYIFYDGCGQSIEKHFIYM